jgi:hypothetical protein
VLQKYIEKQEIFEERVICWAAESTEAGSAGNGRQEQAWFDQRLAGSAQRNG